MPGMLTSMSIIVGPCLCKRILLISLAAASFMDVHTKNGSVTLSCRIRQSPEGGYHQHPSSQVIEEYLSAK